MEYIRAGSRRPETKTSSPTALPIESVIGISPPNAGTAISSPCTPDQLLYAAGCFAVVYNSNSSQQQHLLRSSSSNKQLSCVAWASNGAHVAAGEAGSSASVLIWRLADSHCLHELRAHKSSIAALRFSPDGKLLVSVGAAQDGHLCIWDWLAGTVLWKQHAGAELYSAAFAEDGNHLLAVGNKFFKAWRCNTKQSSQTKHSSGLTLTLTARPVTLKEHRNSRFVDVCYAPCLPGQPLGNNGLYALVDTGMLLLMRPTGRLIDKAVSLQVKAAFGLAAAPTQVAVACAQGVVRLLTSKTLTFKATLPRFLARGQQTPADAGATSGEHFPDARGCSFTSEEELVVVYADQSLIVWSIKDIAQITCVHSLSSHSSCIWDICPVGSAGVSSSQQQKGPSRCVTCAADGTIRFWDLDAGSRSHGPGITAGIIQADGNLPSQPLLAPGAAASQQSTVRMRCIRISPDSRQLCVGDQHGNLRLYDTETLKLLQLLEAHDDEVLCLDYSSVGSDGSFLAASGSRDTLIHIYDAQRGFELLETLDDHTAAVTALKFVSQGLISVGGDRSIIFRVLGAAGGTTAYHVETLPHSLLYDLALGPLEQYVLTTGQDGLLRQWDVASGALMRTLQPEAGAGEPIRLCIDPGGVVAVCCHADGCMRLYHLASGQLLWRAWGHADIVCGAIITSDFTRLVSVGGDGCIIVWKLPEQLVAEITAAVSPSAAANQHNSGDCQLQQQAQQQTLRSATSTSASRPKNAWSTTMTPDLSAPTAVAVAATPSSDSGIPSALLRIQQGMPLVSSRKLPKWARLPASPSCSTGSANVGGSDNAAAPRAQAGGANQPGRLVSKWLTSRPTPTNNKWKMGRKSAGSATARKAAGTGGRHRWQAQGADKAGQILQSLNMDSLPAGPETSTSPLPLSSASATDVAVPDLNRRAAAEATADPPSAGTGPQPLITASSMECKGQQLQQPTQNQQKISGQELPHWSAWPPDADMVVIQDWDEVPAAEVSVEDSALQADLEQAAMEAEESGPLQPELQESALPPLLISEPGPTPGVVRDLFKQHFRSLDAGTGSWLSGPSPDDSTGGQHAVTLMEHRRSLSSLFKVRASAVGLEALKSQVVQGNAITSSEGPPNSAGDPLKTTANNPQTDSTTVAAASAPGACDDDFGRQPADEAAPQVAEEGQHLDQHQHQPERRWRHGKMDAELADMRQRLASLQAIYKKQLQQTKPSPRRARESDDAAHQHQLQQQQTMQSGVQQQQQQQTVQSGVQQQQQQQAMQSGFQKQQHDYNEIQGDVVPNQSQVLSEPEGVASAIQQINNSSSPSASTISHRSMSGAVDTPSVYHTPAEADADAGTAAANICATADSSISSTVSGPVAVHGPTAGWCEGRPEVAATGMTQQHPVSQPVPPAQSLPLVNSEAGADHAFADCSATAAGVDAVGSGSPAGSSLPASTAVRSRASTPASFLSAEISGDELVSQGSIGSQESDDIVKHQLGSASMPVTALVGDTAVAEAAPSGALSPSLAPAEAAMQLDVIQHSFLLTQLLACESPQALPPRHQSGSRTRVATAADPAPPSEAAGGDPVAGQIQTHSCMATPAAPSALPVTALNQHVSRQSGECDIRVSIEAAIAARDSSCGNSPGPAVESHPHSSRTAALVPPGASGKGSGRHLAEAETSSPCTSCVSHDTSAHSKREMASASLAQQDVAATALTKGSVLRDEVMLVSEAAAAQGASITPLGEHVVWPGWGAPGAWDPATLGHVDTSSSLQLLDEPWTSTAGRTAAAAAAAAIPAMAGGTAPADAGTAVKTMSAASAGDMAAGMADQGAFSTPLALTEASRCISAAVGAGDGRYWVSQNPCFDMTPLLSPDTPSDSSKAANLHNLAAATPEAIQEDLQSAGVLLSRHPGTAHDDQQQQCSSLLTASPDLPTVKVAADIKLSEEEANQLPKLPAAALQSDVASSIHSNKARSQLNQEKAAAHSAAQMVKAAEKTVANAATGDATALVGFHSGGMMSLLHRMKKTLPTLKRDSKSMSEVSSHNSTSASSSARVVGQKGQRQPQQGLTKQLSPQSVAGEAKAAVEQHSSTWVDNIDSTMAAVVKRWRHTFEEQQQAVSASSSVVSEQDVELDMRPLSTSSADHHAGGEAVVRAAAAAAATAAAACAGPAAGNQVLAAPSQGPEGGAVSERRTVADLAATVERFRQSVQEMQQLWTQLQELDLDTQDATELQHLLTPASDAARGSSSCGHGVWGQLTRAGTDTRLTDAAACTPTATLSTYRVLNSDSSNNGESPQQLAESPLVAVKQRLQDELLHSIWDLHATVTGGVLPANSSCGITPKGRHPASLPRAPGACVYSSPLHPMQLHASSPRQHQLQASGGAASDAGYDAAGESAVMGSLGGSIDPRHSTDSGLSLSRGSMASPACSQASVALEDIASRVCEQYTELLIRKLDERKKGKSCPGNLPAARVKQ